MKVYIDTETERYPATQLLFGSELDSYYQEDALDVPDETAQRWKAARDAWRAAEDEVGRFLDSRFPARKGR